MLLCRRQLHRDCVDLRQDLFLEQPAHAPGSIDRLAKGRAGVSMPRTGDDDITIGKASGELCSIMLSKFGWLPWSTVLLAPWLLPSSVTTVMHRCASCANQRQVRASHQNARCHAPEQSRHPVSRIARGVERHEHLRLGLGHPDLLQRALGFRFWLLGSLIWRSCAPSNAARG